MRQTIKRRLQVHGNIFLSAQRVAISGSDVVIKNMHKYYQILDTKIESRTQAVWSSKAEIFTTSNFCLRCCRLTWNLKWKLHHHSEPLALCFQSVLNPAECFAIINYPRSYIIYDDATATSLTNVSMIFWFVLRDESIFFLSTIGENYVGAKRRILSYAATRLHSLLLYFLFLHMYTKKMAFRGVFHSRHINFCSFHHVPALQWKLKTLFHVPQP